MTMILRPKIIHRSRSIFHNHGKKINKNQRPIQFICSYNPRLVVFLVIVMLTLFSFGMGLTVRLDNVTLALENARKQQMMIKNESAIFEFDARTATNSTRISNNNTGDPLFHGNWVWNKAADAAYILDSQYLPQWNRSRFFWGGRNCSPQNFDQKGELQWETHTNLNLTSSELKRAFCSAAKGKNILFVGDSITGQTYTSFVHLLGLADSRPLLPYEGFSLPHRNSHEIFMTAKTCARGEETVNATYIRNEFLNLDKPKKILKNQYMLDWWPLVKEHDIIVLNSGRHLRNTPEYKIQMNKTFHWLKSNAKNNETAIFFLSTKIDNIKEAPITESVTTSECSTDFDAKFGMDRLPVQNDFVKNMIAHDEFLPIIKYLDFSCLDLQNSEKYMDPAHSCMPGPVDYRALLFIAKYLMLTKPQWFVY